MPDRFIPLSSGTDMNQVLAMINKNFGELDNESITKVFRGPNGKNSIIEGKLPNDLGYGSLLYAPDGKVGIAYYINSDGKPVLKVAKEGYDALTATDAQLIFNSSKSFTVSLKDSYTFPPHTVAAGSIYYPTTQVIPHNAGYVPAVQCFAPAAVGGTAPPPIPPDFPSNALTPITQGSIIYQNTLGYMEASYGVDNTNLYLGMAYINDTGASINFQGVPLTYYVYTANI